MTWFMAIFLGIVQGVTEFLPVSSSGHLALLQSFGLEDHHDRHLFFDTMLHMGTLVAVFVVYWRDITDMIRATISLFTGRGSREEDPNPVSPSKARLAMMLIIATLPLALAIPFLSTIRALGNRMWFIGLMLLITGGVLYFSDRLAQGRKTERNMTLGSAAMIGLIQVIAIMPGLSRSGFTITAGIMGGLDRAFAVRFSFLLSIPAILGAYLVTFFVELRYIDWSLMPMYIVGTIFAGVTGYFAIHLVRILVKKGSFGKFAYYCWFIGTIAIATSIVQAFMAL
ncbi:MAG: undecaprenyl-diphosphate phosphatase [Oscillospiraceae bacterium]|nr:undecaprenyl-diphosphate phosphatase [Oscillospiraceae bacterium]